MPDPFRVRAVDSTGSTNADVAALAAAGEPAGLVLVAREQTAGRGRLDRVWTSPAGRGLTFSVLLRPAATAAPLELLPLVVGTAVAEALRAQTGLPVLLKWPNDVVVGDPGSLRKLGGILAERVAPGAVVVGVGVNVDSTRDDLPVPSATSLVLEGADDLDRDALLDAVLAHLAASYGGWESGDADLGAYRRLCSTLGLDVRAELPGGTVVEGRAVDLDASGRLLVRTGDGVEAVAAGDIVHLQRRP